MSNAYVFPFETEKHLEHIISMLKKLEKTTLKNKIEMPVFAELRDIPDMELLKKEFALTEMKEWNGLTKAPAPHALMVICNDPEFFSKVEDFARTYPRYTSTSHALCYSHYMCHLLISYKIHYDPTYIKWIEHDGRICAALFKPDILKTPFTHEELQEAAKFYQEKKKKEMEREGDGADAICYPEISL